MQYAAVELHHPYASGDSPEALRACSSRPVTSRAMSSRRRAQDSACGRPGSPDAESRFRPWHVVSLNSCSVAGTPRRWPGSGARSLTSSYSAARRTAASRSGRAKGSAARSADHHPQPRGADGRDQAPAAHRRQRHRSRPGRRTRTPPEARGPPRRRRADRRRVWRTSSPTPRAMRSACSRLAFALSDGAAGQRRRAVASGLERRAIAHPGGIRLKRQSARPSDSRPRFDTRRHPLGTRRHFSGTPRRRGRPICRSDE